MGYIYRVENCKNHFKIVGQIIFKKRKKKKKNDVAVDVVQRESSNIKRYAAAFSNIYIFLFCFVFVFLFFKLKRLTQNPKSELKKLWVGLNCGTK